MAVKIKICGITNQEDASFCAEAGADALGFIFYRKSPRCILAKEAKKIAKSLPCFVSKVGVFVDEPAQSVGRIAESVGLDTLQFHGKESSAYCKRFRDRYKVIKSFFPRDVSIINKIKSYTVDGVLLDIPFEEKRSRPSALLDLRAVKRIAKNTPVLILSGGLSAVNVAGIVKKLKPYAVDVARGVEKFPGKKDRQLVRDFVKAVRKADR